MKKYILLTILVVASSIMAYATHATGGFKGPGAEINVSTITIAEALTKKDDTPVIIIGQIIRQIDDDTYVFQDESGTGSVEIDDEIWGDIIATPENIVILTGEVDKDLLSSKIEVNAIKMQ